MERTMKFMLMMNSPRGDGNWGVNNWPLEDVKNMVGFMKRLSKALSDAGELIGAEGLAMPGQAKRVRAADDGTPITDGVFPETKEFLAGYWIIDVDTPERAYEIAAKASACPGPGGKPLNMPIEVREVMGGPPVEP
jgi:hypothetical protein